jgi:molecular chaperone IbpA
MERKPITRFKKEIKMTFFTTPMVRQFVGFDNLFDELNEMAERKEPNYPAYNIAKDDDEHYRIEVALAGFCINDISLETEKGMLKIEANKKDERSNYIHQGIAQRGFSKVFRLAEHIKVDDARFVDGILTIALRREIPEADRPQKIEINNGPKKIAKAA